MGFLSKVGKGIKKAFKKVGKFVGKLASSKFGKILLIAATVFTLGTALIAGAGAFASTAGTFAAKFVAAGKAFVGALASPLKTAKGLFNGTGANSVASAAGTGATASAASATAEAASAVGAAAPAATPVGALAGEGVAAAAGAGGANLAPLAVPTLAAPAAPAVSGGLISGAANVASKVGNFATSAPGLQLIGNAAQGFAAGKAQEEVLKEQRREREFYDNQYRDPAKIAQLNAAAARPVNLSGGFIDRARSVAEFMNGRSGSGTSAQPGNPSDTYGRYVVGY